MKPFSFIHSFFLQSPNYDGTLKCSNWDTAYQCGCYKVSNEAFILDLVIYFRRSEVVTWYEVGSRKADTEK